MVVNVREWTGGIAGVALALGMIGMAATSDRAPRPWDEVVPPNAQSAKGLDALPARGAAAPLLGAEPMLPMDEARARNAAAPFYPGPLAPAAPFRFRGTSLDLARATQCLALAAMAEAGPTDDGQRAVIQVILNRVRHPAFAGTVCGVVFEGSQRRTGCQFTFTCDGSLARGYADESWAAARQRAVEALNGRVFARVGNATHYHTDWVYPWWSPKLEKIAQVETHLFLRWPGYWGSAAAANRLYRGGEPDPAGLEQPSPDSPVDGVAVPVSVPSDTPAITGGEVRQRDTTGRGNLIAIDPSSSAAAVVDIAHRLCREGATCRVLGWASAAQVPAGFPIPPEARKTLAFSFTRDPSGREIALYDCERFAGIPRDQCIPRAR